MLAVLAGAVGYYWCSSAPALPPQGTAVGESCFSSSLEILTKDGISGDTVDPTKTGKITVVNFWGTWCTPCVNELPYFDRIATDYADTVLVVAVHTNMIHETAPEFIGKYYPDSTWPAECPLWLPPQEKRRGSSQRQTAAYAVPSETAQLLRKVSCSCKPIPISGKKVGMLENTTKPISPKSSCWINWKVFCKQKCVFTS